MKKLIHQQSVDTPHWVGDAFPVRSAFTYRDLARAVSPFLLLDYAGPTEFPPAPAPSQVRGVGEHPHRGFETVTIIYHGEVEHRDSSGGGGVIRPGDVQWMTAAAGVVHEEKHSKEYARTGGPFELIQLWVNLPRKNKMAPPKYQSLLKEQIPVVEFDGGQLRVIAGEFEGHQGPAQTHTPINLWDMRLDADRDFQLKVPADHTAAVFLMEGALKDPSGEEITGPSVGVFEPSGDTLSFRTLGITRLLFMGGEPIKEPIVGYGPFVMNTPEEIRQAFEDYQQGRMGQLPPKH